MRDKVNVSQNRTAAWKSADPLKILHCLRAPVGGLFRHVIDLATAQANLGHRVGVVCAASGGSMTEMRLAAVAPHLQLGLHRLPMGRDLGLADVRAWRQVMVLASRLECDVLHGHGAKGGAYARLAARTLRASKPGAQCFYTPHGGSLHYAPETLAGQFYGRLERQLEAWTDGLLFESRFAAARYSAQIGQPRCATRVVLNGLLPHDFVPLPPAPVAADFVFVGELRMLKGVDVALDALKIVNRSQRATAVFAGDGPDSTRFKAQAQALGLDALVSFPGMLPARQAFARGRVLVMPSRAESLPYIVLEAVAAGMPVLATSVGGIAEIIAPQVQALLPPGDPAALAAAMLDALQQPTKLQLQAQMLRAEAQNRFSVAAMASSITDFYRAAPALRRAA